MWTFLHIRIFHVSVSWIYYSLTPLHRCSWCILQPQPTGKCVVIDFIKSYRMVSILLLITSSLLFLLWVFFFPSVLADGYSLESGWQQIFSVLQDSSQYSGRLAEIWMASTCLPISNSSSFLSQPLETIPSALITIGTTVTFRFHIFILLWTF